MCYDRGSLQAYIDREVDVHTAWETEQHLSQCPACASVLLELRRNQEFAQGALASYKQTTAGVRFNSERAWIHFGRRGKPAMASSTHGGIFQMLKWHRRLVTAVATVALLIGTLSYAPARSIAASFLTIFRAEKIQVITINPDDLKQFEQVLRNAGVADIRDFGKVEVIGNQKPTTVSAAEAAAQAGFPIRLPQSLGDTLAVSKITLQAGSSISITPDVEKTNNILRAVGAKQMLPASLAGNTFTIKVPAVASATYGSETSAITLVQGPGPEILAPQGVDVEAIRLAMLGIPSLPAQLKQQLSVRDWQRTVLVPGASGRSQEVTVNGVTGAFLAPTQSDKPSVLLWQQNGIWYSLIGNITLSQAQNMAGAVK